jgi:uncharacterized membrane protein
MHILRMLFVSTLAALLATFELRCKKRQARNFRQAGMPDISLVLKNEHPLLALARKLQGRLV